jgi:Relaxase/Mobilisation nuclease domain
MVAVIHSAKGFHRVLNYNEQKVTEQVAVCLEAANYPKKTESLTFTQKLKRLENQAALNERTKVNGVHISLNFDPSEQFSNDKLREIATVYMDKIGFGEQPWLLYRHDDSGHPHVHIVTTNIKANGSRIELHNLGKVQSEKARKEIELMYGLLRPEDSKQRQQNDLKAVNVQKVLYGKSATKRAITNVLNRVLNEYKYSSLPELNAVLLQYNIVADRGSVTSRIYQNNGLTYSMLDAGGKKIGVPIKASDFFNKPTLKFLEERFIINAPLKQPHKARVKNAVDLALLRKDSHTLESLMQALSKEGIQTVIRQNENGLVYGLTYVDHRTKCVFNGSDLGKSYSAKAIQERCGAARPGEAKASQQILRNTGDGYRNAPGVIAPVTSFAEDLLQPEFTGDTLPFELKRNKKKKRKRLSNIQ